MSKIAEVYGYTPDSDEESLLKARRRAFCPFKGGTCDGGGNRYSTHIELSKFPHLLAMYDGIEKAASSVCSLKLDNYSSPWIVCPRRLLYFERGNAEVFSSQDILKKKILSWCKFDSGQRVGVWPEVKIKYATKDGKRFDYTFDYILVPLADTPISEAASLTDKSEKQVEAVAHAKGYRISTANGKKIIEDFPTGKPIIIEIMTSSTSGGNKDKRTTISMAFEDLLMKIDHVGPGINYRQVWARMVSQLIVKSQVGIGWGGHTFWVMQDVLIDYINKTTAIDTEHFRADEPDEVNLISCGYSEALQPNKVCPVDDIRLYAGPIDPESASHEKSFSDIIKTPIVPPISALYRLLLGRPPANVIVGE